MTLKTKDTKRDDEFALLEDDNNKIRHLRTMSVISRIAEYILFFMVLIRLLDMCS